MTWSYNLDDLATNEKDQVRLEIGDTDINNQLLQDQEILQAISVENNFWGSAARSCEMISRFFAGKADVRLGRSMQLTYTKMATQYQEMAARLRSKSGGVNVPWVGGMSVAEKVAYATTSDYVQPLFTKTMMQNPWTGGYTSDSLIPTGGGAEGLGWDVNVEFGG